MTAPKPPAGPCLGSGMEVVTNDSYMFCPECRTSVYVVPYDHKDGTRRAMLQEHARTVTPEAPAEPAEDRTCPPPGWRWLISAEGVLTNRVRLDTYTSDHHSLEFAWELHDRITAPYRTRAEYAERACAKAVREFYGCKDERDEWNAAALKLLGERDAAREQRDGAYAAIGVRFSMDESPAEAVRRREDEATERGRTQGIAAERAAFLVWSYDKETAPGMRQAVERGEHFAEHASALSYWLKEATARGVAQGRGESIAEYRALAGCREGESIRECMARRDSEAAARALEELLETFRAWVAEENERRDMTGLCAFVACADEVSTTLRELRSGPKPGEGE